MPWLRDHPLEWSITQRLAATLMNATFLACMLTAVCLTGCRRQEAPGPSAPLVQRGYLWQREWTPSVVDAVTQAEGILDGLVILGGEIQWRGTTPQVIRATIPWDVLKESKKPCAIALRVAPFAGPLDKDGGPLPTIMEVAKSLLAEAQSHGVKVNEFQLDYDCAQKKLAGYRIWLRALRPVVSPMPLVITTLPAWLDEPEFAKMVDEVDGYVLQVHSVSTKKEGGRAVLCDPRLARKWVGKAVMLNRPFSVALPTYWCVAGYDPAGKLLGVSMDGVQPSWPGGTRVLELSTQADDMADLVKEWQTTRPHGMKELLWYRIPVATDVRNWHWPTLAAVMAGRHPKHHIEVVTQGENPVDFTLVNSGEAEETFDRPVIVTWDEAALVASDALAGWTVQAETGRAVFTPAPGARLRLTPGDQHGIGWIRYDKSTTPRWQVADSDNVPH